MSPLSMHSIRRMGFLSPWILWLRFPTSEPACFSCTATHCQHMPLPCISKNTRKLIQTTHMHTQAHICIHAVSNTLFFNKHITPLTSFLHACTQQLCSPHLASHSSCLYFNLQERSSPRSQRDKPKLHLQCLTLAYTCAKRSYRDSRVVLNK